MPLMLKSLLIAVMACIFIFVCIVIGSVYYAWMEAKKEVKEIPREPMMLCNTHGFFPARYAVNIDVDGSETGKIELCPFCTKERVSKKQVPA